MKAAVVSSFASSPRYEDMPVPVPAGDDEILVEVVAAGLHPRVRSQADGSHYTSTGALPLVPGIDGVGRGVDGNLRYFVLDDTLMGSLAQKTVVDVRRSVVLPRGTDPVAVAAAMNPAMGAWIALRCRVPFKKGQNVLILGATGNAGRMAVQVAKHLGAGQIIAVGRRESSLATLPALGATATLRFGDAGLGHAAREADVVLDYVWGDATAEAMATVVTERADRGRPLTWIEIGSVASPTAAIPSAALRAARLQIVGSGIGSVPGRDIVRELPALMRAIARGVVRIEAKPIPLSDIERAWAEAPTTSERLVVTP
jgi:NADPH:quinone reductase-like Zn-dependent oxidoreductase